MSTVRPLPVVNGHVGNGVLSFGLHGSLALIGGLIGPLHSIPRG
jgi:hypothetical protein